MKKILLIAATGFFVMLATVAITGMGMAEARNISGTNFGGGSGSGGGSVAAPTAKPSGTTRVRNLPRSRSRSRGNATSGSGIKTYSIGSKSDGRPAAYRQQRRPANIEELLDDQQGIGRVVTVTDKNGGTFVASGMQSGIDNQLRVDSDGSRLYIKISSIRSIEFLGKDFNKIPVKLNMEDGNSINGTIYSRLSLEFIDDDLIITTRADQLRSIRFSSKQE